MKIKLLAAVILTATAALAHHSFTMFDNTRMVTISGSIKEFQWTNPHTFTWIDVKNEQGSTDTWAIEGMSPNYLGRRGWTKSTLKPGDKVTIIIYPLKDGQHGGTFLRCTLPDGKEMVMFENPSALAPPAPRAPAPRTPVTAPPAQPRP